MMSNDFKELEGLSKEERELALKILSEYSTTGSSSTYNELLVSDYEEIPVDIETFLHTPKYLGKGLVNPEGKFTVYCYWVDTLKKIFPNPLKPAQYNTLALTGAIGLGKSFMAVLCILYELYRMLCLKDPYLHYGLQPIDKITFAVMNITLDAAHGVGWDKLQQLVQSSEWFMAHGTVSKGNNPIWSPDKKIELICGSLSRHIIGRAVFACLDENTEILTNYGDKTLKELVGKSIKVATVSPNGNISYSDVCTVAPTSIQSEEYEIALEDNTVIKCTPDHRFLLVNGEYKEARYLTEDDDIFYAQPEKSEYSCYINNILASRGRFIEDRNTYKERHHIIPKCCNGTNEESNLIDLLPEGFSYGNGGTRGKHNMKNYYESKELQEHRREISSGINNPNYGHGERQSGGNNGSAIYDYWFKDKYFECRKYLLEYLNGIGIKISDNALRSIQNGTYGKCTEKKFSYVIENMSWRLKCEN